METRMTYPPPPPSDPLQPYGPDQPYTPSPPPGADPVSGQPYAAPPSYAPGSAQPYSAQPYGAESFTPPSGQEPPGYPPTSAYPAYSPVHPGKAPGRRRSNAPLIAIIVVATLLLCGGVGVAGALLVGRAGDTIAGAADPVTPPPEDTPVEKPAPPAPATRQPDPGDRDDPTGPAAPRDVTVVYEVTGDGPVDITYLEQANELPKALRDVELPWRVKVTMEDALLVTVVAIRSGSSEGRIRCRALVDGKEVVKKSADGTFIVASCTKLLPR
jgi:hypothetical protein